MNPFEILAEAKIRDWIARGRPAGNPLHDLSEGSLEAQLLREIAALTAMAEQTAEAAERTALRRRARDLRTQLLVLLEKTGRPLAARRVEQMLEEMRTHTD